MNGKESRVGNQVETGAKEIKGEHMEKILRGNGHEHQKPDMVSLRICFLTVEISDYG